MTGSNAGAFPTPIPMSAAFLMLGITMVLNARALLDVLSKLPDKCLIPNRSGYSPLCDI